MKIVAAKLTDFRNLADVALTEIGQANLIMGRNAQGKTNLLEGLFAAISGGSFRLANDRAMIQEGKTAARVVATLLSDDGREQQVQVAWAESVGESERWQKLVRLNGSPVRADQLLRTFPGVIFSPEDIDLIRLSPQYRRRFLDHTMAAGDAEYQQVLTEYSRILRQRNQLLLMIKQGRADEAELSTWDEQLAAAGSLIVAKRKKFLHELGVWTGQLYRHLFNGQAGDKLTIGYLPSLDEDYVRNYLERLQAVRRLDIVRATTTKGVHRDDITFSLGGRDVRTSASRGEFRSIVIALKLAEGKTLAARTGETPMYFLDDVLSELDEKRRHVIAKELVGAQVWLTTSDQTAASLFDAPQILEMEEGRIQGELAVGPTE